jgi:hypothetical protein
MRSLVIILSLCVSQVGFAQETVSVEAPRWSAGAGLGFSSSVLGFAGPSSPRLVGEFFLTPRIALGFGIEVTSVSSVLPNTSWLTGLISVGPRGILTEPTSPVEISVFGGLSAGLQAQTSANALIYFGGYAGLTLERKLMDRLAIRLSTELLRVMTATALSEPNSLNGATRTLITVLPSPALELRFYF